MMTQLHVNDYDTGRITNEIKKLDNCLKSSGDEKRGGGYKGSTALFHLSKFVKKGK